MVYYPTSTSSSNDTTSRRTSNDYYHCSSSNNDDNNDDIDVVNNIKRHHSSSLSSSSFVSRRLLLLRRNKIIPFISSTIVILVSSLMLFYSTTMILLHNNNNNIRQEQPYSFLLSSKKQNQLAQFVRSRTDASTTTTDNDERTKNKTNNKNDETNEQIQDNQWCPFVSSEECQSSPLCLRPCFQRYLIVAATGRSGSTTMMQMLNMLPGIRLTGENNDALSKVYDLLLGENSSSQQGIFSSHIAMNYVKPQGMDDPWGHYPISQQDMKCVVQTVMNSLNPPSQKEQEEHSMKTHNETLLDDSHIIKGFKEVRFHLNDKERPEDVVKKIRSTLPCSRIIINYTSNLETLAKRQYELNFNQNNLSYDKILKNLQRHNQKLLQIAELLGPQQAYVFDSIVLQQDPPKALDQFNKLVKWLGYENCIYPTIVHANKNGTYTAKSNQKFNLGTNCQYSGDWSAAGYDISSTSFATTTSTKK